MSDFIEEFEDFINEICGPENPGQSPEKKDRRIRWKIEKERHEHMHSLEEFMAYRKELDFLIGDCYVSKYLCGNPDCKEEYNIYLKPEKFDYSGYYEGFNGEVSKTVVEMKHKRYFCFNCGDPFYVTGEVRFIRNKSFPRIAAMEDDGTF